MNPKIQKAIELGRDPITIQQVRADAREHLPDFPHNGCADFLSCLLRKAGLADLPVILGAQALADRLQARGWFRVAVGSQAAGDVAVTEDWGGQPGADHIFLVLEAEGPDRMLIADNQRELPHTRFASGKGKTRVAFFLRAPDA